MNSVFEKITLADVDEQHEFNMANLMGVDNIDVVKHCQLLCDPSQLVPDRGEDETLGPDSLMELPEEGLEKLDTLKYQKKVISKNQLHKKRLRNLRETNLPDFSVPEDRVPKTSAPPCEILVRIRVFKEFKIKKNCQQKKPFNSQDFVVLGSQKLSVLRQLIHCINDENCAVGQGKPPDNLDGIPKAKQLVKSSTFFFGKTFYADRSLAENQDYGRFIDEWVASQTAANHKRPMGPFEHSTMDDATFLDLNIRLGFPYVFIHLGNCEHLVVFTDVRLWNASDPAERDSYPLVKKVEPRMDFCNACEVYFAHWIVMENERLPFEPTLMCHKCFVQFNYNSNDEPIGHFVHYPYPESERKVVFNAEDLNKQF